MANNKSAKKRIEINFRNRLRTRFYKSSARTLIKALLKDLEVYKISKNFEDKEKLQKSLSLTYSLIDKGVKKKVHHRNTAAKMKSKLVSLIKRATLVEN